MELIDIKNNNILLFDMDETLIFTNTANFLSYEEAIFTITGFRLHTPHYDQRFNHKLLKDYLENLTNSQYKSIINLKRKIYHKYLSFTMINEKVYRLFLKFHLANKTILATNANKKRTMELLKFHKISDLFTHVFCNSNGNKYLNLILIFNLNPKLLIAFENDEKEIKMAIEAGLLYTNIIKV